MTREMVAEDYILEEDIDRIAEYASAHYSELTTPALVPQPADN